jgi:hypothetical protein
MDTEALVSFFANHRWQKYKAFTKEFTEFTLGHAGGNPKELEKALEFFVDLINRVEFEQKRLDDLTGGKHHERRK